MTQDIAVSVQDRVQTIRMNRAAKKNALTRAMYDTMTAALKAGDADPSVSVHVLIGSGGVFSAGNDITDFLQQSVSDLHPPAGPPGLVIVNPPYGTRIGDKERLKSLYRALGQTLMSRFAGWRVGLVTSEKTLAYATALPFLPPSAPVAHGGLRVTLFQTAVLPPSTF